MKGVRKHQWAEYAESPESAEGAEGAEGAKTFQSRNLSKGSADFLAQLSVQGFRV